jgi:hypothetical protein
VSLLELPPPRRRQSPPLCRAVSPVLGPLDSPRMFLLRLPLLVRPSARAELPPNPRLVVRQVSPPGALLQLRLSLPALTRLRCLVRDLPGFLLASLLVSPLVLPRVFPALVLPVCRLLHLPGYRVDSPVDSPVACPPHQPVSPPEPRRVLLLRSPPLRRPPRLPVAPRVSLLSCLRGRRQDSPREFLAVSPVLCPRARPRDSRRRCLLPSPPLSSDRL